MKTKLMELTESVTKAMVILEVHPLKKRFDAETLAFFQELFSKRRSHKFKFNGGTFKLMKGRVILFRGNHRCLQFFFNNGYTWIASISKLAPRETIKHCQELATAHIDKEYYGLDEEAA